MVHPPEDPVMDGRKRERSGSPEGIYRRGAKNFPAVSQDTRRPVSHPLGGETNERASVWVQVDSWAWKTHKKLSHSFAELKTANQTVIIGLHHVITT